MGEIENDKVNINSLLWSHKEAVSKNILQLLNTKYVLITMIAMTTIIKEYFYYPHFIDEESKMREIVQPANSKQPISGRCGVHTQAV